MKRFVLLFLAVLLAGEYIKEFIHKKPAAYLYKLNCAALY